MARKLAYTDFLYPQIVLEVHYQYIWELRAVKNIIFLKVHLFYFHETGWKKEKLKISNSTFVWK